MPPRSGGNLTLAQGKAAEIISEVEALPAFPRDVWQTSDPAGELARFVAHRASWGVLLGADRDFWACHEVANLVRDSIGAGVANFPAGAPRSALWLKNWRKELEDDNTFSRLKGLLRRRYAVDA